ncbi:unnamed protein product [Lampetra fluviatilis]
MPANALRPSSSSSTFPSSSSSSASSPSSSSRPPTRMLLLLLLLLSGARFATAAGSCRARDAAAAAAAAAALDAGPDAVGPRCCPGRDNSCRGLDDDAGGPVPRAREALCYCDAHCERTGDCCPDHARVCRESAVDCAVGPWGAWSPCDSACAQGKQSRARDVLVPPRNGGRGCPDLRQRRGCYSPQGNACRGAEEMASLLPEFYRQEQKDPWRRPHVVLMEEGPSHCVYFRVDHVSSGCQLPGPVSNQALSYPPPPGQAAALWANRLRRGHRVCAECRGGAARGGARGGCPGEGVHAITTFWEAAWVPGCRGSWVREERRERCRCRGESHAALLV